MKVSMVGRGVRAYEHLTLAGLRALQDADLVFGIEPDTTAWDDLRREFHLPEIVDISFLYRDGKSDAENYGTFVEFVLDATALGGDIALVVAGHPRLGVTLASWLQKELPKHIEFESIDGISSFAAMSNELARDPLEPGTMLVDANRLLLYRPVINTHMDVYVYHPSSVGNVLTDVSDCTQRNRLALLADYLLEYYPEDAVVTLCKSANFSETHSDYEEILLRDLVKNISSIDMGTTLFIGARLASKIHLPFLRDMKDLYANA